MELENAIVRGCGYCVSSLLKAPLSIRKHRPFLIDDDRKEENAMRKVILQEFLTLDGLAAGPNDSVDYVPASTKGDESFGREQIKLMDNIDTILLGRLTYQMFAAHWPKITKRKRKTICG